MSFVAVVIGPLRVKLKLPGTLIRHYAAISNFVSFQEHKVPYYVHSVRLGHKDLV